MRLRTFEGVRCVVAGGSKGIGRALAKELVQAGAHVAILARNPDALADAHAELSALRRSDSQRVLTRRADVVEEAATARAVDGLVADLGAPQLVFVTAGRCQPHRFEDTDTATARATLDVNFFGTWNVVKAVLPHMKREGGVIVPVSSVAGFVGVFGYTDYAASKFAIIGFAESLRAELLEYGIRVSVLCPPDTDTPGFHQETTTRPPETQAISDTASLLTAEDVARYTLARLRHDDFLIIPGRMARVTWRLKRLLPGVLFSQMDSTVRRTRRERPG